jgi:hypothetical protein
LFVGVAQLGWVVWGLGMGREVLRRLVIVMGWVIGILMVVRLAIVIKTVISLMTLIFIPTIGECFTFDAGMFVVEELFSIRNIDSLRVHSIDYRSK